MSTIIIPKPSFDEARERSRGLWYATAGPGWKETDTTQYLFGWEDYDPQTQTTSPALIVSREPHLDKALIQELLTAEEIAHFVSLYPPRALGTAYRVGDIVGYGGRLYRCVQAHTALATNWTPDIAVSLWVETSAEGVIPTWRQPTGAHDAYPRGFVVSWNGYLWTSLVDANVWEPTLANSALWQRGEATTPPTRTYPAWVPGVYVIDVLVTHNGRVWKSLMSGNSYEPGVVGTWRDQSVPPLWVAPAGSIGLWMLGDVVEYAGAVWRSTVNNNSWQPGVYGWVKI